jgi:hypothetical protein
MLNPLQSTAILNFAFCPAELLDLDKNGLYGTSLLSDDTVAAKEALDNLGSYIKYFYVCYSFELDKELYKGKNYFYFQIFYQSGTEQNSFDPFFGIFSENETVNFLNEIDSFFKPDPHEKKMLDNMEMSIGSCHTLVQLMQQWTAVKIIEFTNEYVNYISENLISKIMSGEKPLGQKTKRKAPAKQKTPKKDENRENQIKKPRKKRAPKKDI